MLDNVGYTSSIYTYDAKDYPDWTGDLGVGMRASAIIANRVILQTEDVPHYSFYLENEDLRSWSNSIKASAYSYVGPLNFSFGFTHSNANQRPYLEFNRPFHYINNEWSTEADIGREWTMYLTAYARFKKIEYDSEPYVGEVSLSERLNSRQRSFGIKLNRKIFTGTVLFAGFESAEYIFAFKSERDTRSQKLTLGVEFPIIGALQGSLNVGMKTFSPSNPLFRRTWRPNGRGDVHLTLFERLRLNAHYEFETNFSFSASDIFFDNQGYGIGFDAYLTRFLKAGGNYQDSLLKFHSFLDLDLQRRDRVRQQRYYLGVPFIGKSSIGLSYHNYRLTSPALGLEYTRNYWGGFISYDF